MAEQASPNTSPTDRSRPAGAVQAELADQSLSEALRVSFRLLTAIMALIVIAFLATGMKSVGSTQRGLKTLFGKVVGVAEPGLVYAWPFPLGGVELVDVKEKTLTIDEFWMYESPQDVADKVPLSQRKPLSEGLRPGWEGALLTSDRNLLHARLICKYEIADVLSWKKNLTNETETIRSAVCAAAIRAAAGFTADALQRAGKTEFLNAVQLQAQKALDELGSGIRIRSMQPLMSWPLRALPAFDEVTKARAEAESKVSEARGKAESLLNDAAGASYRKLVGQPWKAYSQADSAPASQEAEDYNLVGQYAEALRAGQADRAKAMLERIDAVLGAATGQAARIIEEARTFSGEIKQAVKRWADRYEQILAQMPKDPLGRKLMYERLWAEAVDEILPAMEKYYLSPGSAGNRTILQIPRDQEILRQMRIEKLQAPKDLRDPTKPAEKAGQ